MSTRELSFRELVDTSPFPGDEARREVAAWRVAMARWTALRTTERSASATVRSSVLRAVAKGGDAESLGYFALEFAAAMTIYPKAADEIRAEAGRLADDLEAALAEAEAGGAS